MTHNAWGSRTDWSVAVDRLTPEQAWKAIEREGITTVAARLVREHAERLEAVPGRRVVVRLDKWRKERT